MPDFDGYLIRGPTSKATTYIYCLGSIAGYLPDVFLIFCYILAGQEFPTLLGIQFSPRYYGIPKSLDVPAGSFPIQFVDSANVTATPIVIGGPTAVAAGGIGGGQQEAAAAGGVKAPAPSYLFPVDRVLRVPVGERRESL